MRWRVTAALGFVIVAIGLAISVWTVAVDRPGGVLDSNGGYPFVVNHRLPWDHSLLVLFGCAIVTISLASRRSAIRSGIAYAVAFGVRLIGLIPVVTAEQSIRTYHYYYYSPAQRLDNPLAWVTLALALAGLAITIWDSAKRRVVTGDDFTFEP